MKYEDFVDLGYKPRKNDLVCLFRVEPAGNISMKEAAGRVASESSVGTWTESLSTETPKVMKRLKSLMARVFEINGNYAKIAYPIDLFELDNIPQILSSIAGNVFGMNALENLRLEDVNWPTALVKSFKGPVYGIDGIRKIVKVKDRPLLGSIVKPKLGLNESEHGRAAYEAWVGGVDIVKDDENLSNLKFNHFKERVVKTLKMRDKAERAAGERKMYMPNVTAETKEMTRRAKFVKKEGGEYAMVDIMTVGWSGLQALRNENDSLKLVLHAHRAGHAALTRNKRHGISMHVVADIARLIGVDQLHIGTVVGKMEGGKEEVSALGEEIENNVIREHGHILSEKWERIKPVFAVCSGGLHPALVPYLVKHLGKDIIMQFGGGIHGHPMGTRAGARAARQATEAVMNGSTLSEYAKSHKELRAAIEKWK